MAKMTLGHPGFDSQFLGSTHPNFHIILWGHLGVSFIPLTKKPTGNKQMTRTIWVTMRCCVSWVFLSMEMPPSVDRQRWVSRMTSSWVVVVSQVFNVGNFSHFFFHFSSVEMQVSFKAFGCKISNLMRLFFQKKRLGGSTTNYRCVCFFFSSFPPPTFTKNQGVLAECLQLSDLPAYTTGGTVHFAAWPTGLDEVRGFHELTPLEK